MRKEFIERPWQPGMIDFILDTPRGMLMADIGMGKTGAVLKAHDMLQRCGHETKPALIFGPLKVARKVWVEEAAKWKHLDGYTVANVIGTEDERNSALRRDANAYAINYDNLPWLIERLEGKWPFGMVIPDESTRLAGLRVSIRTSETGKRYIQGQGTLRARKLAKWAFQYRDSRWMNLSGTPSPNGLKKMYGQMWFIDFGKSLGNSYSAFQDRFFTIGRDGYKLIPRPHADTQIHELMKDVCFSVLANDWLDLKKPIEIPIEVELPKKAREIYRQMKNTGVCRIGATTIEAGNAGAKYVKLLQIAAGAIYTNPGEDESKDWIEVHDEKILALKSLVEESGDVPLIVAYQFKSDLARIGKAFPKARNLVSTKDEDDFKAGKIQMLLVHPAGCGHGIDGFQYVTNRIVFFSPWPDLELRDQLIGRIGPVRQHQAGFERPVYIYDIIATDTRDEGVLTSHDEKREIQDFLLSAMRR